MRTKLLIALGWLGAVALFVSACGGTDATATPPATATQRPTAAPLQTPTPAAQPTQAPTATVARPTPTPAPQGGVPTPIVQTGGKRGGSLNLSILPAYLTFYDLMSVGGRGGAPVRSAMYNNLLWPDPYNPSVLVGDIAQGWEQSDGGMTITFTLRRGIKFHDGQPVTSKDIVYNIDRAWKPRTPTMTEFVGKLTALKAIDAPDEYTVRLTLNAPSLYLLAALSNVEFLVYPSHWPIEDQQKFTEYKKNPIGSGPFKFKSQDVTKQELVRNDDYWKPGLPYVDAITMFAIGGQAVTAAFRTGKIDATSIDIADTDPYAEEFTKSLGYIKYLALTGGNASTLNQRPPFNDARVRQAYSMAYDRFAFLQGFAQGRGSYLASPMPPPDVGGQFGIPAAEMKDRPGFSQDKTADIAKARQIIAQAGIDPSKYNIDILTADGYATVFTDIQEAAARELGFKTTSERLPNSVAVQRTAAGTFDVNAESLSIMADDPLDFLAPLFSTGGSLNWGKWSNPQFDALLVQQDSTQDPAKRKETIRQIQEIILTENTVVMGIWRQSWVGHFPWVKNYPGKLPFLFSPRFRWEQVWLERAS